MNKNEISFANRSVDVVLQNIINQYESLSGRTLSRADPVRLMFETLAAVFVSEREIINYSAKQNLLAYAKGNYLDCIGDMIGVDRLQATHAKATAIITLSAKRTVSTTIPAGTRVTADNNIFFEIESPITIVAGEMTKSCSVRCTEAGKSGNGFSVGELKTIVDPQAFVDSIVNTTESNGGTDIEDDEAYRERIRLSLNKFSCAGPKGSYEYWAKSANQLISDVSVYMKDAGIVAVVPLLANGQIPTDEIIADVSKILSDDYIRPLTDKVEVSKPVVVSYNVNLTYYINTDDITKVSVIQQQVNNAISEYKLWQRSKIGRSINPSELVTRIRMAGASRVELTEPISKTIAKNQIAVIGIEKVNYGGVENG